MRPLLVIALLISACGNEAQPPLIASDIEITAPLPGQAMSAGYLSLTNNSTAAIRITKVTSPEFAAVEIHQSLLENGVAKMRHIPVLTIPAGTTVKLERGGVHLMLLNRTGSQRASLSFYDGATLLLDVSVPMLRADSRGDR